MSKKFADLFFRVVYRLIFSRFTGDVREYISPGGEEQSLEAWCGPLRFEVNECYVTDHDDAAITLELSRGDSLYCIRYRRCYGQDQIRDSGFRFYRVYMPF